MPASPKTSYDRSPGAARRLPIVLAGLVGIAATVSILYFPSVRFAYYSPEMHVALETSAGMVTALGAFLFFGRLRESPTRNNWALVYSLMLFAVVNVGLAALPSAASDQAVDRFSVWATAAGRLCGSLAFAYAACASRRPLRRPGKLAVRVMLAVVGTVGLISVSAALIIPQLPQAVYESPSIVGGQPTFESHVGLATVQLLALLLYALSAVGFARQSARTGDELMRWLAAAAVLGAFARLHYFLYPSLYTDWVFSGDIVRLGSNALILYAAAGEIRRYWNRLAVAAAADERRRIARDLHDGLAQELAYIASRSRSLDQDEDSRRAVQAAAERALDESRRAIAALSRPASEPFEIALANAAEEVANRVGTSVEFDLQSGASVDPQVQESLIRIAREAIANAGRHGNAQTVNVRLSANGHVELAISDDGTGFDTAATFVNRFGLISMRERAEQMKAEFSISSSPGRTTVEVTLP